MDIYYYNLINNEYKLNKYNYKLQYGSDKFSDFKRLINKKINNFYNISKINKDDELKYAVL